MRRRTFIQTSAMAAALPLLSGNLPASAKPGAQNKIPVSGEVPRLWYTGEQLRGVGDRIASGNAFFTGAYGEVLRRAEEATTRRSLPYAGSDPKKYRDAMRRDAQDALALALKHRIGGDETAARTAVSRMNAWASHEPLPGSTFILDPVRPDLRPGLGMSVAMPTAGMIQAYALLVNRPGWNRVLMIASRISCGRFGTTCCTPAATGGAITGGIAGRAATFLRTTPRHIAFGGQRWQNHLGCHCMGLLCAGYALGDAATVRFALDHEDNPHDFKSLLAGAILMPGDRDRHGVDPAGIRPGEIYDRYRTVQGKGLMYSFLHLRFLLNAAEIALHNGRDFYDYTAPGGENLLLPFRFLGETLLDGPEALEGTYYENHEGEQARIAAGLTRQWYPNLFLVGRRRYPDDPIIAEVCRQADTGIFVRSGHYEVFSYALAYGYGTTDI